MIFLELDSGEIDSLANAARSLAHVSMLEDMDEFRLTDDDTLKVRQSITDIPVIGVKTNVQIVLSCDKSGKLLIRFVSLADNWLGNCGIQGVIKAYSLLPGEKGGIAGIIESRTKTKGKLVRVSDDVLSFDCTPMKIRSVSISRGTLSFKAEMP